MDDIRDLLLTVKKSNSKSKKMKKNKIIKLKIIKKK